ncbi:hypothetical protein ACCO45_012260 [Purpureocillium lilacinum]|uniref:Uncharacterized protein n=1 Tax=Purpureocillium lilacinum TaxID=33203 RepID=A0ACC4DDD6_PURLI
MDDPPTKLVRPPRQPRHARTRTLSRSSACLMRALLGGGCRSSYSIRSPPLPPHGQGNYSTSANVVAPHGKPARTKHKAPSTAAGDQRDPQAQGKEAQPPPRMTLSQRCGLVAPRGPSAQPTRGMGEKEMGNEGKWHTDQRPKASPPCRPDSLLGRLVQPHTRASASHAETGNTRHTRTGGGPWPQLMSWIGTSLCALSDRPVRYGLVDGPNGGRHARPRRASNAAFSSAVLRQLAKPGHGMPPVDSVSIEQMGRTLRATTATAKGFPVFQSGHLAWHETGGAAALPPLITGPTQK